MQAGVRKLQPAAAQVTHAACLDPCLTSSACLNSTTVLPSSAESQTHQPFADQPETSVGFRVATLASRGLSPVQDRSIGGICLPSGTDSKLGATAQVLTLSSCTLAFVQLCHGILPANSCNILLWIRRTFTFSFARERPA